MEKVKITKVGFIKEAPRVVCSRCGVWGEIYKVKFDNGETMYQCGCGYPLVEVDKDKKVYVHSLTRKAY